MPCTIQTALVFLFSSLYAAQGFVTSPPSRRYQVSTARFSSIAASDDLLQAYRMPHFNPSPPCTKIPQLVSDDFPDYFTNMMHPLDGIAADQPMQPKLIWHRHDDDAPYRLVVRMSVAVGSKFVPLSFVCDTREAFKLHVPLGALQRAGLESVTPDALSTPFGGTGVPQHEIVVHN